MLLCGAVELLQNKKKWQAGPPACCMLTDSRPAWLRVGVCSDKACNQRNNKMSEKAQITEKVTGACEQNWKQVLKYGRWVL